MFVALLGLGAAASGGSTDMRSTQHRREDSEAKRREFETAISMYLVCSGCGCTAGEHEH